MKKFINGLLPSVTLLLFVGCHKGQVSISQQQTGSNTVLSAGEKSKSKSPSAPIHGGSVLFSSLRIDEGKIYPNGIGFSEPSTKSLTPFVFHYTPDRRTTLSQSFVTWPGGVVFIKALDDVRDAIIFTRIPDLESQEIYIHDKHITSLSAAEDFHWLAWTDETGATYVWHSFNENISTLSLPKFFGLSTQIAAKSNRLLVLGKNSKDPANPTMEVLGFDLSEAPTGNMEIPSRIASLDRLGKWLALVEGVDGQETLSLFNLQNPDQKILVDQGAPNSINQLSWSAGGLLAYWIKTKSGKIEIRVVNPDVKKPVLVSTVWLSAGLPTDRIICPSWLGTTLYYGGVSDGKLSIFQSEKTKSGWRSQLFAKPDQNSDGFACPSARQGT
jgi:hypothetical protein